MGIKRQKMKEIRDRIREEVRKRLRIEERKIHWRQVRKTTWALLLTVPYLLLEWSGRAFHLYSSWPPVDSVIHFLFGVAFTSVAALIYGKSGRSIGVWMVIVSFAWEGFEQLGEVIQPNQPPEYADIFFWDGVMDMSMNMLGAALIYLIMKRTGLLERKIQGGIDENKSGVVD